MQTIHSPADFSAMLQAEQAIVLISFDGSKEILPVLPNHVVTYQINPNQQPFTWKWVNETLVMGDDAAGRRTSLVCLTKGAVVALVPDAALAGEKILSRITNDCFALGKTFDRKAVESLQNENGAFDAELLKILCCPETHQKLQLAAPLLLEKLNRQITGGNLRNRSGQVVGDAVDGGLVCADGRYLYPLRQNIPVLLVDEAIPLI